MNNTKVVEWVLRIAVAGEFLGHGVLAIGGKPGWIPYFESVGISAEAGAALLPWIGWMDVVLAVLVLVRPVSLALLWMTFWGFATALIRPIAGEPIWDFVERFANIGAPLALLMLRGWPKSSKEWLK